MARPFMFAALCQRAHPLKHSLAGSIFISRVKQSEKIFVRRKILQQGHSLAEVSLYLLRRLILDLHVTVKWRYGSNEQTTGSQQLTTRIIKKYFKSFFSKACGNASSKARRNESEDTLLTFYVSECFFFIIWLICLSYGSIFCF